MKEEDGIRRFSRESEQNTGFPLCYSKASPGGDGGGDPYSLCITIVTTIWVSSGKREGERGEENKITLPDIGAWQPFTLHWFVFSVPVHGFWIFQLTEVSKSGESQLFPFLFSQSLEIWFGITLLDNPLSPERHFVPRTIPILGTNKKITRVQKTFFWILYNLQGPENKWNKSCVCLLVNWFLPLFTVFHQQFPMAGPRQATRILVACESCFSLELELKFKTLSFELKSTKICVEQAPGKECFVERTDKAKGHNLWLAQVRLERTK